MTGGWAYLALVVQRRSGLALALTMEKIKTFLMSTFTFPFFASPNTSSATSCAKSLPSFAVPNTSSVHVRCSIFFKIPTVDLGDTHKHTHGQRSWATGPRDVRSTSGATDNDVLS